MTYEIKIVAPGQEIKRTHVRHPVAVGDVFNFRFRDGTEDMVRACSIRHVIDVYDKVDGRDNNSHAETVVYVEAL